MKHRPKRSLFIWMLSSEKEQGPCSLGSNYTWVNPLVWKSSSGRTQSWIKARGYRKGVNLVFSLVKKGSKSALSLVGGECTHLGHFCFPSGAKRSLVKLFFNKGNDTGKDLKLPWMILPPFCLFVTQLHLRECNERSPSSYLVWPIMSAELESTTDLHFSEWATQVDPSRPFYSQTSCPQPLCKP